MINYCDLGGAYNRYCGPKKLPENLSSFLHQICGTSNLNYRNDASWYVFKFFKSDFFNRNIGNKDFYKYYTGRGIYF